MGGVVAGALVGLLLFALDFTVGGVGFMGMRDPRVIAAVMERARAHAVEQQLLALAVLVTMGALMGAVGVAAARAWGMGRGRAIGYGIIGAFIGHGYFLLRSMTQFPQLYSAHFYERGGVLRAAMILVTDHLSTTALDVVMTAIITVALVVPLLSRAGRAWARRHTRPLLATSALAALLLALPLVKARAHPTAHPTKPNLLLIAVDSLRSDRLFAPASPRRRALRRWRRWRRSASAFNRPT